MHVLLLPTLDSIPAFGSGQPQHGEGEVERESQEDAELHSLRESSFDEAQSRNKAQHDTDHETQQEICVFSFSRGRPRSYHDVFFAIFIFFVFFRREPLQFHDDFFQLPMVFHVSTLLELPQGPRIPPSQPRASRRGSFVFRFSSPAARSVLVGHAYEMHGVSVAHAQAFHVFSVSEDFPLVDEPVSFRRTSF